MKSPTLTTGKAKNHRQKKNKGFSLLEMMAVLVLLGIMAGLAAPATGRFLNSLSFRRQTAKIMKIIRYARLISVTKAQEVHLTLADSDDCQFMLSGAIEESKDCGLQEGDSLELDREEIIFYPEGQASPAQLTFSRGERIKTIYIEVLTGLPITK
ncbi:MAG: prepilin-type N-terminal cleavage/methylation domain-containing protein [Proteobacteria bacterium]|nr:prepilin-type N-terminal cleavage/methylation domain-containing protein [Pseudomonadota bacterium]MBU1716615.1 prepilin-type N-terminal cleavage/methylation domain-containing protein [Pseudomonadota bacterium]